MHSLTPSQRVYAKIGQLRPQNGQFRDSYSKQNQLLLVALLCKKAFFSWILERFHVFFLPNQHFFLDKKSTAKGFFAEWSLRCGEIFKVEILS